MIPSNVRPAIVLTLVAIIAGMITAVGLTLLCAKRKAITLIGINVTPLVFKTKKVIIPSVAFSFCGFYLSKYYIAFKPKGVATEPKPNIFAAIFDEIYSKALSFLTDGNNFISSGFKR